MKRSVTPLWKDKSSNKNSTKFVGKDVKNVLVNRVSSSKPTSKLTIHSSTQNQRSQIPQQMALSTYLKSQSNRHSSEIKSKMVNQKMRKLAIQWMIQLCHQYNIKSETLFIATYIIDFVLGNSSDYRSSNLQLLCISCIFIASKYEEIYPKEVDFLIETSAHSFSKREILQLETKILMAMDFKVTFATRFAFISLSLKNESNQYLCEYDPSFEPPKKRKVQSEYLKSKKFNDFVLYLLQISLLDWWQDILENEVTEGALFLASKVLRKEIEPKFQITSKIMTISYRLMNLWKENESGPIAALFDNQKYSFVGGLRVIY